MCNAGLRLLSRKKAAFGSLLGQKIAGFVRRKTRFGQSAAQLGISS